MKKVVITIKIAIRKLIHDLLRHLPISSEMIGPPKGVYKTTVEWMTTQEVFSKNRLIKVYSREPIYRVEAKTIEGNSYWAFDARDYEETQDAFVACIGNGRVWGTIGAIISPDDKLIDDLSLEFKTPGSPHPILKFSRLGSSKYFDERVAVLSAPGGNGYYHWMFDVLPRFHLIKSAGISFESIDKFILSSCNYSFHRDGLSALGINLSKVLESTQYPHIKAKELIVPSLPGTTGHAPKWVCQFLRDTFLSSSQEDIQSDLKFIYISRANAHYRKVTNEQEVLTVLESFGFKTLILENLSLSEQVSIFKNAKVVVASHGAGLSNVVFCDPKTKIIELFSPAYVNLCYWTLCSQLELDYYYLIGEGTLPDKFSDPHKVKEDMSIEIKSFSKLLHRVMDVCINTWESV